MAGLLVFGGQRRAMNFKRRPLPSRRRNNTTTNIHNEPQSQQANVSFLTQPPPIHAKLEPHKKRQKGPKIAPNTHTTKEHPRRKHASLPHATASFQTSSVRTKKDKQIINLTEEMHRTESQRASGFPTQSRSLNPVLALPAGNNNDEPKGGWLVGWFHGSYTARVKPPKQLLRLRIAASRQRAEARSRRRK